MVRQWTLEICTVELVVDLGGGAWILCKEITGSQSTQKFILTAVAFWKNLGFKYLLVNTEILNKTLKVFLKFVSIYLCESGFLAVIQDQNTIGYRSGARSSTPTRIWKGRQRKCIAGFHVGFFMFLYNRGASPLKIYSRSTKVVWCTTIRVQHNSKRVNRIFYFRLAEI